MHRFEGGPTGPSKDAPALAILIARLDLRARGAGEWRGRCPVHQGDSTTALSVTRASDGTILVHCHAHQCSADEIIAHAGLSMIDLFPSRPDRLDRPAWRRRPTHQEIIAALRREADRVRARLIERHAMLDGDRLLTDEVNHVRERVSRLLGIALKPLTPPWSEQFPHSRDPMWPACVDHALRIVAAAGDLDADFLRSHIARWPGTQQRIIDLARETLRGLAR